MNSIISTEHLKAAENLKKLLSAYQQAEDLISIGAYQKGTNAEVDRYLKLRSQIMNYLQQSNTENTLPNQAVEQLQKLERINQMMSNMVPTAESSEQQSAVSD